MKRPRHRPRNEERIASMRNWLECARDRMAIHDPDSHRDLYGGQEFVADPKWTPEYVLTCVLLAAKALRDNEGDPDEILDQLCEDQGIPRDLLDWYQLYGKALTRSTKMNAYQTAADLFNAELADAQHRGQRLREQPTNGSALRRAIAREACRTQHGEDDATD